MHSAPNAPLPLDAMLHSLADGLARQLAAGEIGPCLVRIGEPDATGFDLGFKPIDDHPAPHLLGFVAPKDWHGLGVVSAGWAYHLDDRMSRRNRFRVFTAAIVSRSGEVAHETVIPGRPELEDRLRHETVEGEQLDLLRCALGVETPPPPCAASVVWAIDWLVSILDADADELPRWGDIVRRHPAARFAEAEELAIDPVRAAQVYASVNDWARLRAATAEGGFEVPDLIPSDALWLDVGAFARFVLTRCPPLSMLRAQVRDHLGVDRAALVDETLRELEVPLAVWPETADDGPVAA